MKTRRHAYALFAGSMAIIIYFALFGASMRAANSTDCRVSCDSRDRTCESTIRTSSERPASYRAFGVLKRIDERNGTVTVAHEEVQELKWPAMTMVFRTSDREMLRNLVINRRYELTFVSDGKQYIITDMR